MSIVESLRDGQLGDAILVADNFLSEAGWISISFVFYVAFFHPSDAALVHINKYGEKWAEAVLLPIMLLIAVLGTYVQWYRWRNADAE